MKWHHLPKESLNKMVNQSSKIIDKVSELSEQNFYACYQCGRCSAGCPAVPLMDTLPNQVIRFLQLGMLDDALQTNTIWICASCFTCTVRCPKGVDLAKVMEALRQIILRKNEDYTEVKGISEEEMSILPQIALVSNFRKQTA